MGLVEIFFLFHFPGYFGILFKLGLSGSLTVTRKVAFISTFIAYNMIQVSPGSLLLHFSVALVFPSFTVLCKHELVSDPFGLIISLEL